MTNRMGPPATAPAQVIQARLRERGLSQMELARLWRTSQAIVSYLASGQRSITPLVALRLEASVGGSAWWWMELQARWDLDRCRRDKAEELREIAERREQRYPSAHALQERQDAG